MAVEKEIKIVVDSKQAEKSIDNLTKDVKNLDSAAEDTSKSTTGIGTAFKGVGVALKAIGIGAIIALFAKLAEILSRNQKVVDFFSTAMGALEIAFNDLFGFISNNAGTVVSFFKQIFENPLKSIKELGRLIKENIIERFESVLEVAGFLGSALKKLFTGDLSGALDDVKEAGKEAVDVFTGVDDTVNKVTESVNGLVEAGGKYLEQTIAQAKANVELANTSRLAVAQQARLIEQYDRQAEKLRQIRDADLNTIEDRIKANEDLAEVLEKQEKAMLSTANAQVANAVAQKELNNNIDNQIALTDALANREGVLAQIEGFRSEQLANRNALLREQYELNLSIANGEDERKLAQLQFEEAQAKTEEERFAKQKERLELENTLLLADIEVKREIYKEGTQARVDAENEFLLQKQEIDNQLIANKFEQAEAEIAADDEIAELKRNAENERKEIAKEFEGEDLTGLEKLEKEKELLELQNEILEEDYLAKQELYKNDKVALAQIDEDYKTEQLKISNALLTNEKESNNEKLADEERVKNAKIAIAGQTLNVLGGLAKEGSDLAKGIAVAQSTINTYQGVTAALSATSVIPDPFGSILKFANAAAVGVAGFINVKKILSTKPVSTSAPSGAAGTSAPPAPSFNLVEGSGTNQIAEGIAGQNQPLKAFVVSSDVTSAQEMDRNIVDDSGF